jgi:endoglucanase
MIPMKLKNALPAIALLLFALLNGCEKDLMTDPVTNPSDGMSLLLKAAPAGSPVATHGQIYVSGRYMKDRNNATMNLRGQSFGWSSWWPQYWNANVVSWLASDFKVDIVRAAMGIDASPGYLTGDMTNQKSLTKTVVNAAIATGVYVIIDWHCEATHQAEAVAFFGEMAQTYGSNPNVIYEILNEPTTQTWAQVKTYAAAVIAAIRQYDPDNIIVVGCPQWDQVIRQVADAPLTGYTNIMYTVHFYAASHGQWLRDDCSYAIGKNIPIFVTECSGMDASGSGAINYTEWEAWFSFMEANSISWCNWSVSDKAGESCSILLPGAPANGGWTSAQLNESGNYIRTKLRSFAGTTPPPAATLPGTVQAESYSAMSGIQTETCSEGGLNVGYIESGDWMDYLVNPSSAGSYTISLRVASTGTTGACQVKSGSTVLATVSIPNTGGWQNWTTITTTVNLTAGSQTIRLQATGTGWNINWWSAATNTVTNKLSNPGFETTANWTIENPPFSRSTVDKRSGSYSLRLAGTTSWKNTYQTVSVTPNTAYTFSVYIKGTAKVYMAVYKADWSATVAAATKTPTASWVKYTVSFNSGSNSQLIFDLQDAGSGTSYLDDASVL